MHLSVQSDSVFKPVFLKAIWSCCRNCSLHLLSAAVAKVAIYLGSHRQSKHKTAMLPSLVCLLGSTSAMF